MLEDINKEINQVKNEVAQKNVLENRLKELDEELHKSEIELKNLETQLEKELDDVEKLKKLSFASIVSSLMRNKEEKLEKEEKEYLMAKIKYDNYNSKVKSLREQISYINFRVDELADCEDKYSRLLQRKIVLINIYGDEETKNKLVNMEREIDSYLEEVKEIEESIVAGNRLLNEVNNAKKLLESSKTWGTIDLLGGDFLSSLAKHEKVNDAQKCFRRISNLLDDFNRELKDVNITSLNFSTTIKAVDIFFDNIFTDITVNRQINNSYEDVCKLQTKVSRILNSLKENKNEINKTINIKKNEYDEFTKNI
ncbi:hypothetical protein [Terrisporobacter sp.]|uniref:hypothetical protein n=1 Tax=Terrisporobacter sp. TaxID=1965305 RepID=UPI00261E1F5B|nr:hypothetical protein [Terrisporobacter sp.]